MKKHDPLTIREFVSMLLRQRVMQIALTLLIGHLLGGW